MGDIGNHTGRPRNTLWRLRRAGLSAQLERRSYFAGGAPDPTVKTTIGRE
jgi:hypothetical protein